VWRPHLAGRWLFGSSAMENSADGAPGEEGSNSPKPRHPSLEKCTVHGTKGGSYVVTCDICGLGGEHGLTTSVHKLTYGHYLQHPGSDIRKCVSRSVLTSSHEVWFAKLTSLEDKLNLKRK
jgi:hypothetical protein